MPTYDPAGLASGRNDVFNAVRTTLQSRRPGAAVPRSGAHATVSDADLDAATGYWDSGKSSKPPRWLFLLEASATGVEAKRLAHAYSDRLGYFNSTAAGKAVNITNSTPASTPTSTTKPIPPAA